MNLHKILSYISIMVLSLVGMSTNAEVIFQDDFSDATYSNQNWYIIPYAASLTFTDGQCNVDARNATVNALVRHAFPSKPVDFSISCEMTRTSTGISGGLFFCVQYSDVEGYALYVGDNSYLYVYKYTLAGSSTMLSKQNAAVSATLNQIEIRKEGNSFTVYCNSVLVGSFTDSGFDSGDIALIVQKSKTAIFDNVLVTDNSQSSVNNVGKSSYSGETFRINSKKSQGTFNLLGRYVSVRELEISKAAKSMYISKSINSIRFDNN